MAVPREPVTEDGIRHPMWTPLLPSDFVPVPSAFGQKLFVVGGEYKAKLQVHAKRIGDVAGALHRQCGTQRELQVIVEAMDQTFEQMDWPSTEHNLVRQVATLQRH